MFNCGILLFVQPPWFLNLIIIIVFNLIIVIIIMLVVDLTGPSLKIVASMSVGIDHIDIAECRKLGIKVGYTPNVLTEATAELTIALLLATSRRLFEAHQQLKT